MRCNTSVIVSSKRPEELAHLTERRPSGRRYAVKLAADIFVHLPETERSRLGLHVYDAHTVCHHVVQLSCDASSLLDGLPSSELYFCIVLRQGEFGSDRATLLQGDSGRAH